MSNTGSKPLNGWVRETDKDGDPIWVRYEKGQKTHVSGKHVDPMLKEGKVPIL